MGRMLLAILLLPLAAAVPLKTSRDYALEIVNGTLMNVRPTGSDPLQILDLSGLDLADLDKAALDNVPNLKTLSLANNFLTSLPDFVFSNLTDLEALSLANNQIRELKNLFVGLRNLRKLNLSGNPIAHIRRGQLYGLSQFCEILTDSNILWSMSTGAFTSPFLKDEEDVQVDAQVPVQTSEHYPGHSPGHPAGQYPGYPSGQHPGHPSGHPSRHPSGHASGQHSEQPSGQPQDQTERCENKLKNMDTMSHGSSVAFELQATKKTPDVLSDNLRVKLCMNEGEVISLQVIENSEVLTEGCREVKVDSKMNKVDLSELGIRTFQEGWYQLMNLPIATLDLSKNEITEITKELLNDLPMDLVYVNLLENKIRQIWSQVIENEHLRMINLKGNQIELIEDDALQKTKLTGLFLTGNRLEDLNFVATLPQTITEFVVTGNQLVSIPSGVFSNLPKLVYLNLGNNKIDMIPSRVFEGLNSLQVLILTRNSIAEIEPNAFSGLKYVTIFYAYKNKLTSLRKDTFNGLDNLKELNLAWNNLTKITKEAFNELPSTLEFLHLDDNQIDTIESESFQQVPKHTLSLNNNRITNIPLGTFNLSSLQDLHLDGNKLETIDGDSFVGLPTLKHLYLSSNFIQNINKGACKNLGTLNILNVSKNPFNRLDNGAFYGMSTAAGTFVYMYNNRVKVIQGGIFDDV